MTIPVVGILTRRKIPSGDVKNRVRCTSIHLEKYRAKPNSLRNEKGVPMSEKKFEFEADTGKILDIVINSLYSQ